MRAIPIKAGLALAFLALTVPYAGAVDVSNSAWSETDASNNSSSPNGWAAGMLPSSVMPTGRAMMGAIRRFYDHINATVTSGGTNTATLTYSIAPAAYATGDCYTFIVGGTNTGATTLNVNSLGAKNIKLNATALTGNELIAGDIARVCYDGTSFQLVGSSGTTGTGKLVRGTGGTLSSPTISSATITSPAITTATITNPNIIGTTTNDDAAAGSVGEYISSSVTDGNGPSLSTGTTANITSISLTAGDWDVYGAAAFHGVAGGAGTCNGAVTTTSATVPTTPGSGGMSYVPAVSGVVVMTTFLRRVSLSGTTTTYLVGNCSFGGGAISAHGFIGARRVR